MAISVIKYGSFAFPYNPEGTTFSSELKIAKHQYPSINGADIEIIGREPIEISCNGLFFSASKTYLTQLYNEYKLNKVQTFSHPLFPDCTKCVMTQLSFEVRPEEDVIHYKFTVIADNGGTNTVINVTPKKTTSTTKTAKSTKKKKTYKTTKKKQSIASIVSAIRKKYKKNKPSKAQIKKWNPQYNAKAWNNMKKGAKVYYYM